jgi:hypothetical protein
MAGADFPENKRMPDYFSDNHGDNDGDESVPAVAGTEAPEGAPNDDQPASQVALLPMDFFGGKDLQPGHTCKVKIEKVLDDQVQVSYVGEEGGGGSYDMME